MILCVSLRLCCRSRYTARWVMSIIYTNICYSRIYWQITQAKQCKAFFLGIILCMDFDQRTADMLPIRENSKNSNSKNGKHEILITYCSGCKIWAIYNTHALHKNLARSWKENTIIVDKYPIIKIMKRHEMLVRRPRTWMIACSWRPDRRFFDSLRDQQKAYYNRSKRLQERKKEEGKGRERWGKKPYIYTGGERERDESRDTIDMRTMLQNPKLFGCKCIININYLQKASENDHFTQWLF